MPVNALYRRRKIFSTPLVLNTQIPIELTKYMQTDYIERLIVQVTGNLITGAAGGGTATGRSNPEDLLVAALLTTSPTVASISPFNQVSGRSILLDAAMNRRSIRRALPISDNNAGAQAIDICYELVFKRNGLRKAVEYGFDISRYTGALLTLTFGDYTRLFTGSGNQAAANTSLAGLTINVFAVSAFNVNPDQIHGVEFFEQNFPVLQTQPDFLINQLPAGFIYTDLCFLMEQNNLLTNGLLTNIDIEGGGRIWFQLGDNNADVLQRTIMLDNFDGSVKMFDDPDRNTNDPLMTGIYPVNMRNASGMFSRQIDALTAQIIIKLGVNFLAGGPQNVRLFGRRMVPGAVYKAAPVVKK
jgi:hypothetical protein